MKKNISEIVNDFSKLTILVIGDVMVDSYLLGNVSRISPEAPVPVVNCKSRENRLGGAANVALNIKAMGATPLLCTVLGKDHMGDEFLSLVKDENLQNAGIYISDDRQTTVKSRVICNGQQLLRIDSESELQLSEELEQRYIYHIIKLIESSKLDAIIFEDYDKGALTPRIISLVLDLAKKNNIPTLADPKKRNFFFYKNITLFKPNLKEFMEGIGVESLSLEKDTLASSCKTFKEQQGIEILMVTLSEKGIFISGSKDLHFPTEARLVADVSGAGDTVISVASLCIASGLDNEIMIRLSNLAGGQVCEKSGVVPVNKKDLIEQYKELYEK